MPTKCICDENGKILSIKTNDPITITTPTKPNAINLVTIKDVMIEHNEVQKEVIHETNNIVVDLLCVVLSMHSKRIQFDTTKYYTSFLITDASLPKNTCAKIHIYDNKINDTVKSGDVFRFNSMMIKQNNYSLLQEKEQDTSLETKNNQSVIVCEFVSSWRHPEAGPIYIKLNDNCNNLPPNMISTPMKQVYNLQKWYEYNHAYNSNNQLLQSSALSVSKCRRRKIRDITTSHLLSDVTVQVLSIEKNKRKYQSISNNSNTTTTVMIKDGTEENDIITCSINNYTIQKDLENAFSNKSIILFTRLLSHCYTNYDGIGVVYLEVTDLSQVINVDHCDSLEKGDDNLSHTCTSEDYSDAKAYFSNAQNHPSTIKSKKEILGKITDIYIPSNNTSLLEITKQIQSSDRNKLSQTLIDHTTNNNLRYRNAIISIQEQNKSSNIKINTNGEIIQMLLCNTQPNEIQDESLSNEKINLLKMTFQLLHGMLHEEVIFRWIIEFDNNEWNCLDVRLLELHV